MVGGCAWNGFHIRTKDDSFSAESYVDICTSIKSGVLTFENDKRRHKCDWHALQKRAHLHRRITFNVVYSYVPPYYTLVTEFHKILFPTLTVHRETSAHTAASKTIFFITHTAPNHPQLNVKYKIYMYTVHL